MTTQLRYGVMGTGRMAARMVSHIRESGNSTVSAVASSSPERAAAFARRWSIGRDHASYAGLVDDAAVDVVYIALPNSAHASWCRRAMERGKHVLCEKPIALNAAQLDELMTVARHHDRQLMECLWHRFHPLVIAVKSAVEQSLGAPRGFYSTFSFENRDAGDIRWNAELGGGALNDLMCYQVDALHYLLGRAGSLTALEAFSRSRNGVEANVMVEAVLGKDCEVVLSSSIDRSSLNRTTIVGTDATLVIPHLWVFPENPEPVFYVLRQGVERIVTPRVNAYAAMVQAFSAAVIGGHPVPVGVSESMRNVRLLDAIRAAVGVELADRIGVLPSARRRLRTFWSRIARW